MMHNAVVTWKNVEEGPMDKQLDKIPIHPFEASLPSPILNVTIVVF